MASYQNEVPGDVDEGVAPLARQGGAFNPPSRMRRVLVACVALGSALVFFRGGSSSESYEETIPSGVFDQVPGGIMSSSHKMAPPISGLTTKGYPPLSVQQEYWEDLQKIDWKKVEADMKKLLTDSKEWWPADYGTYAGLFIRLSWHSCGSYRLSDGRGGCDGGGQRYVSSHVLIN